MVSHVTPKYGVHVDVFDKSARGGENTLSFFILGRCRTKYTSNRHTHLQACKHQTFTTYKRVTVKYLNSSLFVSKSNGGHRLGRFSTPQPSLRPDIDSTLRTMGQWKFLIVTDLTRPLYQISLSRSSIKYCGTLTPYKDIRVNIKRAKRMPGSEIALEKLMCRIFGAISRLSSCQS